MDDLPSQPLVIFTPSGKRGRFPVGTPVLTAARQLGVDLDSVCGGRGICSRCQITPQTGTFPKHGVTVGSDALSPWNAVEQRYDDKRGLTPGRRLGCQATVQGDCVIDVPASSQVHRQVVRKRAEVRDITLDPATRLFFVEVAEPDMHNPMGDMERLLQALEEQWGLTNITGDLRVLQMLQPALRQGNWRVTVAIHATVHATAHAGRAGEPGRILQVWPGFYDGSIYGIAFDVGSTTIAGHLCDLQSGEVVASSGVMNPQIRFGEDLMSRVSYSMMNPGGAGEMTLAVRAAINELTANLAQEARLTVEDVVEAVLVGNPVMHHLLLGIDPVELGGAPFALATSDSLALRASEIGLDMHPGARLYTLPCIAGHVGADAAAVALSEQVEAQEALTLVVDVGTNAEILLGNRDKVLACSSPTGPAFEGAQISAGQRAAPGAIERVEIDPVTRVARFRVIGCEHWSDTPEFTEAVGLAGVTGICGSGIIEVIAEMRLTGIIGTDGAIGPGSALGPCVRQDGRTWSYVLHDGSAAGGPVVTVTQNDIRAIQLAKAALYAGARLLMDQMGVDAVDRVVLAGAFGAHISPKHAMVLGMIPDCPLEAVSSAGNAAGTGARIALLNIAQRRAIEQTVRQIEKVETAVEPRFQEHFVAAMAVPHKTAPYPNLATVATLPDTVWQAADSNTPGAGRRRRRARA
ncbi:MAG: ASKHA domain-containing protein [Pseudomonadota bacterium]